MPDRQPSSTSGAESARLQVKQEVRRLRSLLKEITQAYLVRREAEIAALVSWMDELKQTEGDDKKDEQRLKRTLEEITKLLSSLKIKPEKGRLRDIRRLHTLVDDLHKLREQQGG
jgi:hypothetical protein